MSYPGIQQLTSSNLAACSKSRSFEIFPDSRSEPCHPRIHRGRLEDIKHTKPIAAEQCGGHFGRALSHPIPLARLKCLSDKRRKEMAAWLGGRAGRGAAGIFGDVKRLVQNSSKAWLFQSRLWGLNIALVMPSTLAIGDVSLLAEPVGQFSFSLQAGKGLRIST
jgi:hypothetical protein